MQKFGEEVHGNGKIGSFKQGCIQNSIVASSYIVHDMGGDRCCSRKNLKKWLENGGVVPAFFADSHNHAEFG
jgi:hypothetical protein